MTSLNCYVEVVEQISCSLQAWQCE